MNGAAPPSDFQWVNEPPTLVDGTTATYRYAFTGALPNGVVQVQFLPNGYADLSGANSVGELEQFTLATPAIPGDPLPAARPTARLGNPNSGAQVSLTSLRARRYIDVTFDIPEGTTIVESTLGADDFTLTGAGVGDAAISNTVIHVSGTTYRYRIVDSNATNATPIFAAGEVRVVFAANSWDVMDGGGVRTANGRSEAVFTVEAGASDAAVSSSPAELGPLFLQGPSIGLGDMGFDAGKLTVTVMIGADTAGFNFGGGQSGSGISAELTGLLGTFDVEVNVLAFLAGGFGTAFNVPGRFKILVNTLEINIPNVVRVNAEGIEIEYDPASDDPEQELVSIDNASVNFDRFGVAGQVEDLVIRRNGFNLGSATLLINAVVNPTTGQPESVPGSPIELGSILEFDDLRIGITDFGMTFGEAVEFEFDGSIFIASGGARFLPDRPVRAVISDRASDVDTEAIRLSLVFENGRVKGFSFVVDTFRVTLGSYLTLFGQDLILNTDAAADEEIIRFGSIGAEVTVAGMVISGEGRNFAFLGDGSFRTLPGFGVFLGVGSATGEGFSWPSWLPVRINQIGIEWRDIEHDPTDFILTLSVSVTGIKGAAGLEFSGAIEGVKIDIGLLLAGQFPIIDIASIAVSVRGKLFGGDINAGLLGGILKLDASGNMINPIDSTTPVAARIFFMGVQGGFNFSGIGVTIRFALSELGPLGVFLNVSLPSGVMILPQFGLVLNDFSAGVEFFQTLPDIDDPKDLRGPAFQFPGTVTAETWLASVKLQVIAQYQAIQADPSRSGFEAAFTSTMVITGGAKIYSLFLSQQVFNGLVVVKFSTDGKFFIGGRLNFADNNISVSAKLYANFSKISSGEMTVLFLADIPDQVELLTIYGRLKTGFRDSEGRPVQVRMPELPTVVPAADLGGPRNGDTVGLGSLKRGYVDVQFTVAAGSTLDHGSIVDLDPEFDFAGAGVGNLKLDHGQAPVLLNDATDTYRFWTVGEVSSGAVSATFIAGKWFAVEDCHR